MFIQENHEKKCGSNKRRALMSYPFSYIYILKGEPLIWRTPLKQYICGTDDKTIFKIWV